MVKKPSTLEFRSDSSEQTRRLAAALGRNLRPGDLVALEGELGAGKTCFVRGLAEGLGLDPAQVSSPTFVIAHEYEPSKAGEGAATLIHVDAYRLPTGDDLETIGWSEIIERGEAIIALEWPARVADALPRDRIDVRLEHAGDHARAITITAAPAMSDRLATLETDNRPSAVTCRTCGRPIDDNVKAFPFCSDRCRLADLGRWFNEGYRVTRPTERDEELSD
jgi:tRNA threonylcarbamoyladenosine biosynthesis protein TsaE